MYGHVPVMRNRMGDILQDACTCPHSVILDGTLGAGGHSEYFLERFPESYLIAVDRDAAAMAGAKKRLERFGDRVFFINKRFDQFPEGFDPAHPVCAAALEQGISGALFDLGVSSMQLDEAERGFAYKMDAPLDMRMDQSKGITAADILNTYDKRELTRILKVYGEERFASRIADAVVTERQTEPFSTSARLVELLYRVIPAPARRTGGHPAKRTFQALRVEVNKELEAIENVLPEITSRLALHGRAIFMSYQSLEDKIVKSYFAELTKDKTPPGLPMPIEELAPHFALVTRGAEKASKQEIEENPRAASVRVRAVERVKEES
ncbi:MAG: 16S rRNA (cytosine(1402)-N(4))-methyltransferase RsmH [Corynebacterium sp.]|nr:16S rRNA (cytosine(1402)-N(4))-methyltransferase RsmH [Corynebacterium sp.]